MNTILIKAIVGSQSYGTNIPESDTDYKSVHIAPLQELLLNKVKPQIDFNKDDVSFEISRFLELLKTGNPTVLELLFTPEDCIIEMHPLFKKHILPHRDKFLTKKLKNSFCGYAYQQIEKANGLDKKMNWEKERIVRKTPRDFCYVIDYNRGETHKYTELFTPEDNESENFAVTKANHVADGYFIYKKEDCLSFYPIDSENSNSLKCSSVKKGAKAIGFLYFNKSEYTKHCADFKSYEIWLKERNEQRYVDSQNHGQKIDGKNMLHCMRLIETSLEIAKGEGLNVRRDNAEELKKIRRGEVDLNELLNSAKAKLDSVKDAFNESDLPDDVDPDLVDNILYAIREEFYDLYDK